MNVVDGAGPAELVLSLHDDGGRRRSAGGWAGADGPSPTSGWDLELRYDRPVRIAVDEQSAIVTAGWTGVDTLDVAAGCSVTTWRARLAWAPDGSLTVQSRVFGEAADQSWNFHAAYAAGDEQRK